MNINSCVCIVHAIRENPPPSICSDVQNVARVQFIINSYAVDVECLCVVEVNKKLMI